MTQKLSPQKKVVFLAIYFFGILVLGLIGTEIAKIDYKNGPQNRILQKSGGRLIDHHFNGLYVYDDDLGWVPAANRTQEMWGYPIHIRDDGLRSNGQKQKKGAAAPLIMAFGGSFTFGDNVADHQTWPAHLEAISDYHVLNGGVSSYGLDQSILRAEKLVEKYRPDTVVVSSLRASLRRAQAQVRHGAPKPYFEIDHNQLVLRNHPVPFKENTELDGFRSVFGYSYFINKFMDQFFPEYWWRGTMNDFQYSDTDQSILVNLLLERLDQMAGTHQVKVILLLQGTGDSTRQSVKAFDPLKKHIESNLSQVQICDTTLSLLDLKERAPLLYESYFKADGNGHMSSKGNYFIATQLKQCLRESESL